MSEFFNGGLGSSRAFDPLSGAVAHTFGGHRPRGTTGMRIAFYATLKPPDHPVPSGDRMIARGLLAALNHTGADVRVASRLSSRSKSPAIDSLDANRTCALDEARALIAGFTAPASRWRPDLWFTYHVYYKAPDWIGSTVARAIAIPYVMAEASYAGKRDRDAWAPWQREAVSQMQEANRIFCFSAGDREGLAHIVDDARLRDLPAFLADGIDSPLPIQADRPRRPGAPLRLVTVAMMRADSKLDSYRDLALALDHLQPASWHLTIVGDGPVRTEVQALYARFPSSQVTWAGLADEAGVRAQLYAADLFVWPGIGEALGMVYLEAQASGLPVVAYRSNGTQSVMRDGKTGLLVAPGDVAAFAAAIAHLRDQDYRARLGAAAHAFVRDERSLPAAAKIIGDTLTPLVSG